MKIAMGNCNGRILRIQNKNIGHFVLNIYFKCMIPVKPIKICTEDCNDSLNSLNFKSNKNILSIKFSFIVFYIVLNNRHWCKELQSNISLNFTSNKQNDCYFITSISIRTKHE